MTIKFSLSVAAGAILLAASGLVAAQSSGGQRGTASQKATNSQATSATHQLSTGAMSSRPNSVAPLSATECTDLGGTVGSTSGTEFLCKSQKMCFRADQNGKIWRACITE